MSSFTPYSKPFVFPQVPPSSILSSSSSPVDASALVSASSVVSSLKLSPPSTRSSLLLSISKSFGDLPPDETTYIVPASELKSAYDSLPSSDRLALERVHSRIKSFALLQRSSVTDVTSSIPGGTCGQTVSPCTTAGCYAPGGRYPLPSSVLMTCATARAAGCRTVVCASPRPVAATLAAAHIAGVDIFVKVGGAQAIAAMAFGVEGNDAIAGIPSCDVVVGPGNKWVTAAKSLVSGHCGIDMLAGPSEVLVIADSTASADIVAADLIAQAEHDVVARPILLCTEQSFIDDVNERCAKRLSEMPEPNRSTALEAFAGGFSSRCDTVDECVQVSDRLAPEHLQLQCLDAEAVAASCRNYGGLFIGEHSAEVLGDYGAGPNHTLPTGGTGRYTGGLSVFNFLRIRTWLKIDDKKEAQPIVEDSITMARMEGLEGHARAAECRKI